MTVVQVSNGCLLQRIYPEYTNKRCEQNVGLLVLHLTVNTLIATFQTGNDA